MSSRSLHCNCILFGFVDSSLHLFYLVDNNLDLHERTNHLFISLSDFSRHFSSFLQVLDEIVLAISIWNDQNLLLERLVDMLEYLVHYVDLLLALTQDLHSIFKCCNACSTATQNCLSICWELVDDQCQKIIKVFSCVDWNLFSLDKAFCTQQHS